MFDFEKFPVYIKTAEFLSNIQVLLRNKYINLSFRDQLHRASSSILLNIAEGAGKSSKKDKKNFYTIARGSAKECVAILKILRIENHLSSEFHEELNSELNEMARMLSGLIKVMTS